MTSLELLSLLAPEHDSVAEQRRTDMLAHVASLMDASSWGGLYQTAAVRLTAHELSLDSSVTGHSGAGAVQSVKAGKQSVSYGAVNTGSGSDAVYATTRHGVAYLALLQQRGIAGNGIVT